MNNFYSPYLSLIALIGLFVWTFDFFNIFKNPQIFLPDNIFSKKTKSINGIRLLLYLIGVFAWISLGVSLARPRTPQDIVEQNIKANDIYFVVDVSRSMLAEDFKPNRITVARKNIFDFIKMRPTDRIGIIIFAREVFTLMPLTTDLSLIEDVIEDINVGRLGSATNIGDALGLSVARLIASKSKNKIIILMTDGVSNAGNLEPRAAAEAAVKKGMKVYTIGIGSSKGAKLPLGSGALGKRYQNIPGGSIDIELLKDIAKITKAKFYLAENENTLRNIFFEINDLEKTEINIKGQVIYKENYLKYLIVGGLLLLFVEFFRKNFLKEIA